MTKLFKPMTIGGSEHAHRIVMAPLTRYRCDDDWTPLPIVKEYYAQRACVPGTLIISEATIPALRHAGRRNVPGIWSQAQIAAWREITDVVHLRGCRIWCQLWVQGRAGHKDVLDSVGSRLISSSAVPLKGESKPVPEPMSEDDIWETIGDYATAARNAVEAGFDGVEIHGANGYLPDQFLQDTCNQRNDKWGGNIENRCRFHLDVAKAVATAIGAHKTAMRLSPWSDFLDMLMEDPIPTFTYLVKELKKLKLGYLSLIEARLRGNEDCEVAADKDVSFLVKLWDNVSPVLIAGGFTPESANQTVDEKYPDYDVGIIFGRYFVSNPDLVFRVRESVEMLKYDRSVFYTPKAAHGYIDYPYCSRFLAHSTRVP
ncbi:NADH:flavin oxidoreductase/NADH oxidase family protein [Hortaea werneckii]|uniref:NADH:flavin oxidoreductase/NADH oxidase N-terminal domain-containing protein n=1 Tax=Hortaea werneckii TaxID=91943 RepID=A0A3M7GWH5_HORWE|nr:NADH:flavin oxidoreductase/NADH oxidase family protein [Hortaea werneckii]KAI7570272.1 NADH:flavin oxidoreductase/NADH oxidase family protein [Hortaea werneckii]KAI7625966.1 NADH:flavin oxidoreductase/NADH oxidase family protein [Hortaea werneckii]KAI7637228.1 NADH:flavin oxidoreductase/NADH oxidase family protein [Hortaea werneckii]KAI7669376.1 NADH:flavin oxidoreductase/NADH oxidase family protein [Hortaea werneckii]